SVRDDGRGVSADHGTGLGLSGMRERVGALDGSFALDNGVRGAVVRISIPVPADRGEDASRVEAP
ncbi:ATPase, partial [Methylobacterium hispanicum]